jgi:diamine N-acetyltransferase
MHIRHATPSDIEAIIHIAQTTWPATYASIISEAQINFMLDAFYNKGTIAAQLADATQYFFMAEENNAVLGYAHIIPYPAMPRTYKLSKLYLLPSAQGKQIGKQLLQHCEQFLLANHMQALVLNVNRHNPAVHFYKKMNYHIIQTVDIPLDQFWLNDYVMKKELSSL